MSNEVKPGVAHVGIPITPGKTPAYSMARSEAESALRHVIAQRNASASLFADDMSSMADRLAVMDDMASDVAGGDISIASRTMVAQAMTLDAVMTQMLMRAQSNMAEYPQAHERYMRLALKAQAQSRATLEALAKLHTPREQIVRHIHVNDGGQAIVADQISIGRSGGGGPHIADQCDATRAIGSGESASLPGPNPVGNGVPVACGAGKKAVSNARRD